MLVLTIHLEPSEDENLNSTILPEHVNDGKLMLGIGPTDYDKDIQIGHKTGRTFVNQSTVLESLRECKKVYNDFSNISDGNTHLDYGSQLTSPETFFKIFKTISKEAKELSMIGFCKDVASKWLAKILNLNKGELDNGIESTLDNTTKSNDWCVPDKNIVCNVSNPYRSADGTCNNIKHPYWGASQRPYRRILPPDYADGIHEPRIASDGSSLTNPRKISETIFLDINVDDSKLSMMFPQWGQFIAHDLGNSALSPGLVSQNITCCTSDGQFRIIRPECLAVKVPHDDEFYARPTVNQGCLTIIRSATFPSCKFGPSEQFNERTAYLDGSGIYGSDTDTQLSLRGTPSWKLNTSVTDNGTSVPPPDSNYVHLCSQVFENKIGHRCFKGGDSRINEFFGLTSMHLIWIRQHNRVAEKLSLLNPLWNDERTFQETRKIIAAQIQHIAFNEFLPPILGPKLMKVAKLELLTSGYYKEYDKMKDSTLANVFSTAAYRFGHSMLQTWIKMLRNNGNFHSDKLSTLMFKPFLLYKSGLMDDILRGLAAAKASKVDTYFTHQMTRHLFQNQLNGTHGFDIGTQNIMRGRDHGIPGYVFWRQACALKPVRSFDDLYQIWPKNVIELARKVYRVVEDIDLYVGGVAEIHSKGSELGPTFGCLIAEQFSRIRQGDRFWYESDSQPLPFTPEQLSSIRMTTLARILCDNSDKIYRFQPKVLLQVSNTNQLSNCNATLIPQIDYTHWRDV